MPATLSTNGATEGLAKFHLIDPHDSNFSRRTSMRGACAASRFVQPHPALPGVVPASADPVDCLSHEATPHAVAQSRWRGPSRHASAAAAAPLRSSLPRLSTLPTIPTETRRTVFASVLAWVRRIWTTAIAMPAQPSSKRVQRRHRARVAPITPTASDHRPSRRVSGSAVSNAEVGLLFDRWCHQAGGQRKGLRPSTIANVSGTAVVKSRPAHLRNFPKKNLEASPPADHAAIPESPSGRGCAIATQPASDSVPQCLHGAAIPSAQADRKPSRW